MTCKHEQLKSAFCPHCGEANDNCVEGERLVCVQLLNRAIQTNTTTQEKHRRGAAEDPRESRQSYARTRIESLERRLVKLRKALEWVNNHDS